jgi:limonene-1,2-epoxide hydrolase
MGVNENLKVLNQYLSGDHATDLVAHDAVFRLEGSGGSAEGREAITAMLNDFYHGTFDARVENARVQGTESGGIVECDFVGRQVKEFAGMAARADPVRIPLCVVYDIEDSHIQEARIYFMSQALSL